MTSYHGHLGRAEPLRNLEFERQAAWTEAHCTALKPLPILCLARMGSFDRSKNLGNS